MKNSLLIVEDDPDVRESLVEVLAQEGYEVAAAENGEEGLHKLSQHHFDAALIDLRLPKMTGLEFLKRTKEICPHMDCIMMTSFPTAVTAVDAMKIGAVDYISKPINDKELKMLLERTLDPSLKFSGDAQPSASPLHPDSAVSSNANLGFHNLVGEDAKMQKIYSVIEAIKDTDITVLLKGESGTGKGMIAQAIHQNSPGRKNGPYVEVSCGAIPRELLESELFGHVKGAFTSAIRDRIGRFELANGGTVLLDEIDALPPYLQVKLLRVIQNKVYEMVGDVRTKKTDVRIIAATNRDLQEEIKKGNFREDLYYRLKVITIEVPPLRERKSDILPLTRYFLTGFNQKLKRSIKGISKEAVKALLDYDWPGNVRELENTLEWIVVLAPGEIIGVENLPPQIVQKPRYSAEAARNALKGGLKEPEKKLILEALEKSGGNRKKAANILNISRTTLYNKLREHQISDL